MVRRWLRDKMHGRAPGAGARVVDKFVRGLRAMEEGDGRKGGPFPGRVWQEWNMIPLGLEPE